jgi:hypothetical protein
MKVSSHATTLALILLLAALTLTPNRAAATAMASAEASLFLTIADIVGGDLDDLIITIDAFVNDSDAFFLGNASAMFAGEATPDADGLTQISSATATADPTGFSDAFHFTDGFITLENISADTLDVMFSIEFMASASASINDPVNEDSFAFAEVSVTSVLLGPIVDEAVFADGLFGISDPPVSDAFDFSLPLAPGESEDIETLVDADAIALAFSVPEPATFLLVGTGLICLVGFRRKFTK